VTVPSEHMVTINEAVEQIEQRNLIRREALLPPVSVSVELRKLHNEHQRAAFETFLTGSPLRSHVEQKLLKRIRRQLKIPSWTPTSGERLAFHMRVRETMKWIWLRQLRRERAAASK
jgi:hypothetical protein